MNASPCACLDVEVAGSGQTAACSAPGWRGTAAAPCYTGSTRGWSGPKTPDLQVPRNI